MEFADLQNLNSDELAHQLESASKELHGLRQRGKMRSLKAVHKPKAHRRLIARIKTILHSRATAPKAK